MPPTYYVGVQYDLLDYIPDYYKRWDPMFLAGFATGFATASVMLTAIAVAKRS